MIYTLSLPDQIIQDTARLFINDQSLLSCFLPGHRATYSLPLQRGLVSVKTEQWRHTPTHLLHLNTDTTTPCPPCCLLSRAAHCKLTVAALSKRVARRVRGSMVLGCKVRRAPVTTDYNSILWTGSGVF